MTTALAEFVQRSTRVYRKGEVVKIDQSGPVDVVSIDAFPERTNVLAHVVDCHFVEVGFTEHAADGDSFRTLFAEATAGPGEFQSITPEQWMTGLSYITIGAWIGDQTLAFQLMALATLHYPMKVVTPRSLFGAALDDAKANQMAGAGYVMLAPTEGASADTFRVAVQS